MNYEYDRQNNGHATENCTGVTKNNAHKTKNRGPLRLNYVHMRENNAYGTDKNAHLPK